MGNIQQKSVIKKGKLFTDIKQNIRPFDLIAFRGDEFVSNLISKLEKRGKVTARGGTFTHVGMVITDEILDNPLLEHGKLYILESVISGKLGSGVPDIQGKSFLGVQIRDLERVAEAYDQPNGTLVAWIPILENPILKQENIPQIKKKFTDLYREIDGILWDSNFWSLLSALYPKMRIMRPLFEKIFRTQKWLFCSEMVAIIYKHFNILPQIVNPKDVIPADLIFPEEDTDIMPKIAGDIIFIASSIHYSPEQIINISNVKNVIIPLPIKPQSDKTNDAELILNSQIFEIINSQVDIVELHN